MADIRAFRAFRYDLGRVGSLGDVVAPPYDVIDADLQRQLYDRSPYNVIRLELNREEAGDSPTNNRYTRAAGFLRDWQADGVLKQDSARALYVCEQDYEVEGKRHTRRGFFGRVRLEPLGTGNVFPHEETMSGPKADRLSLYKATHMNLSPVFGMYPDEAGEVHAHLEKLTQRALPLEATDHLGVVSKLWPITDQQAVSAVTGLLGPKPIFIADGHHRYETGLRYLDEKKAIEQVGDEDPARFVLMMLVSMSDPGLLIQPTHRLLSGGAVAGLTAEALQQRLEGHFQVEPVGTGPKAGRDTWEMMQADGGQGVLGFGTRADGVWQMARLRTPDVMDQLAAEHSSAWRGLAVSILHRLVLDRLLTQGGGAAPACKYVHQMQEVESALAAGQCELAALVPPATMAHVAEIAGNREKMPPKSTYFYPKLLSGLVFNSLKVS